MQAAPKERYVLVTCGVCRTRMHPPAEWVGRTIHCPDCGTAAIVPQPPLARPKPRQADPGEYALGENWSREPTARPAIIAPAGEPSTGEQSTGDEAKRPEATSNLVLVKCTVCGTRMHFPASAIGRKARCPDCNTINPIVGNPIKGSTETPKGATPKPRRGKPSVGEPTADNPPDLLAGQYDVGAAHAPPPVPTSFVAPRAIVERLVVPDPPRWTFFSGVFGFPWSRGVLPRWAGIASGLLVAGGTMAIVLGNVNGRGLGRETVLAAGALGLLVFFSLVWSLSYAAGCMLVIVRETAEGADEMNESPDIDWRDWIFQLVYMGEIMAQGVAIGWFVRWLLKLALPGTAAPEIGLATVTFVAFPVLLLSALESGSALLPFSGPILRSLFRLTWAWALFYLLTAALLIPILAVAALIATPIATLGWLAPAPLVAAYLLIYARLLGRLGWLIGERLQPPELDLPSDEQEPGFDLSGACDID